MKSLSILVLDDEIRVREEIEEFLVGKDFKVFKASAPSEAFKIFDTHKIDLAILDIKLPEMDGLEVLKILKKSYPDIEVIMISGHGDIHSVIDAMRLGATDYFQKPFRLMEIHGAIERTKRFINLQHRLKEVENNYALLSRELQNNIGHRLLGKSQAVREVIGLMSKVAKTPDTSILITGESGTGKELVARGIHYLSSRNKQYFYSVNCSAVPESLFESEFFGHKKGSFTGASEDKAGWFEIANKGTLFLDEISDMPLNQQAKLLRVIEEKKISKVGTHSLMDVDVRVIAASNRKLEQLANESRFRLDLYHRLSSFIIDIPPLRERKDDIPLLVNHFIQEFSVKLGKPIKQIDPRIFRELIHYDFPGNIRELKNIVERAMIICDGDRLGIENFEIITPGTSPLPEVQQHEPVSFDLDKTEKELIQKALKKVNHNKTQAAKLLNITWQSLDRRMKKFKLEGPQ